PSRPGGKFHIPIIRLITTWLSRCGRFLGVSLQVLTTLPEGAMLEWVPTFPNVVLFPASEARMRVPARRNSRNRKPLRGDSKMTLSRTVLLMSGLVLALSSGAAQAQANAQDTPASRAASKPMVTLQMPALPAPVPVILNPKTTALLVFDYVEPICNSQPKCKGEMLPAMTPFMARVRKAGLVVAYGTLEENVPKWLPEVAPLLGDINIVNTAQDRFYNTDLDKALKAKGITTII